MSERHSPLGASGAERWMNCPGSHGLLKKLELPETDEPDYRREGIAGHEAAAYCLRSGIDTWEIVGETYHETKIDASLADAIQVYLDAVRPSIREDDGSWYVEHPISSPIHPLFYGTLDFGADLPEFLDITDLKMGEGIIVEPENNPQLMYYAFGFIEQNFPEKGDDHPVRLRIVQPRAFHLDGPVREWLTTVGEIKQWVRDELVPAMHRAELDATLDAGPWCRFCPAKLVCPLLTSLFKAAALANPKEIINYNDESLGRSYQYTKAVEFYLKAMQEEAYRRLNAGRIVPGIKLVTKKAHRVWKVEAQPLARERFGELAWTKPEMKSPAELDKLGPTAKGFTAEFAYMPQTGLTVALEDDKRPEVKVQTTAQAFGAAVAALTQEEEK